MCIAYIEFQPDHAYPLRIAANRDEFHQRPALTAHYWQDAPGLLAGRDLEAGGTWLGVHPENGRFALVTNFREPGHPVPSDAISRGHLVQEFLTGDQNAANYLAKIAAQKHRYAGFNLIVGEHLGDSKAALWYYSNRAAQGPQALSAGQYVLSNHLLDTPWPKTQRLATQLQKPFAFESLSKQITGCLHVLRDSTQASDAQLPSTGVSQDMEKLLSSIFIVSPEYGSRCSTIMLINASGHGVFCEQSYDPTGQPTDRIDWPLQLRPNSK